MSVFLESKRRDYSTFSSRFIEDTNLWIYNYYHDESKSFHYDFKEYVISEKKTKNNPIYDPKFVDELSNIEAHENVSGYSGNMVHYIISGCRRGCGKRYDGTPTQRLLKANRISSRRMEIISEIAPEYI